ncbi:MAG: endonuclease III domain-containing protein [Ktedonobacterales bacterium]
MDPKVATEQALRDKVGRVYALLVEMYGVPPWEPDGDALGGLIATVLSQHTSDTNSTRAYADLVARYPRWEAVRDAPVERVAEAIRMGGLAWTKAQRIQAILRELTERMKRAGMASPLALGMLDAMDPEQAQTYLRTFPGVGPKTAACVLLFSLGKAAFPVDTHVWRVTKRLGLIGPRVSAEAAHTILLRLIPADWRHTMHVNLIQHGRERCHARQPECQRCDLRPECLYFWELAAGDR